MKVSIITAVYNNCATISQTIDSVLSQSYADIEYIIIDGNSTDGTSAILNARKKQIDILISEPDKGIYDAINKGIKAATGDIVGILNSDDFFPDPNVLQRIVKNFDQDKTLEAVYSDIDFVTKDDISRVVRHYSSKRFRTWMFRFGFQPAHPTFYVKRYVFQSYGFYQTNLPISGDFELMLRFLYLHRIKYKYVEDLWVKMRIGGISTSGIKSVLQLNNEIMLALKLNNIKSYKFILYFKYLIKWWGFAFKKG